MSQHGTTISFTCRKCKVNKQGEAPIGAVIRAGGSRIYLTTGRFIRFDKWDEKKQQAKGNSEETSLINEFLNEFRSKVYRKELDLIKRGFIITAEVIKDAMNDSIVELQQKTLLQVLNVHNAEKKEIGRNLSRRRYILLF